jgi:rhamnosyltransferase
MSDSEARIWIVLSAYNGARYIREQIESIRSQSVRNWRLLVRDDGSTDETVSIVVELAGEDPRIELLPPDGRNLKPPASFGVLLEKAHRAGIDHVFLADQDDIWLPAKLSRQLEIMGQIEARVGRDTPVLVHSDLRVVADDLRVIHDSFREYHRIDRSPRDWVLRPLLAQNLVTGCATVVNRALLEIAVPLPRVAMHDWWLAQCAAAVGVVASLDEPMVLYRQHGGNVVGANGLSTIATRALRQPGAWWAWSGRNFLLGLSQARELDQRVGRLSTPRAAAAAEVIAAYCAAFASSRSMWRRIWSILCLGVRPVSLLSQALFFMRVLLYPRLARALG